MLMSMGAWRVSGEYLDGGLTFFVILTGLIGLALIALLDKMD